MVCLAEPAECNDVVKPRSSSPYLTGATISQRKETAIPRNRERRQLLRQVIESSARPAASRAARTASSSAALPGTWLGRKHVRACPSAHAPTRTAAGMPVQVISWHFGGILPKEGQQMPIAGQYQATKNPPSL